MWCVYWDPCGLACFIVTWFVIWFTDYCVQVHILQPWFNFSAVGILHATVFQCIIFLICASHLKAVCTDPGSVAQNTATEADAVRPPSTDPEVLLLPPRRFCNKCQCLKPARAAHCSVCHRCIHKMDHHCPWVNNCVGQNNQKFFLLFLFYVFTGACYALVLITWRLVACVRSESCGPLTSVQNVLAVVSIIFAIFFAIFVGSMASDQWEGMVTNTTGIEALKGWEEEDIPLSVGLREAFGEPFSLRWFLPVAIPLEAQYHWSPTDDKDAYDPRDPLVKDHQAMVRARLSAGQELPHAGQYRDSGSDDDFDSEGDDYARGGHGGHNHSHSHGGHSHTHGHSHSHGAANPDADTIDRIAQEEAAELNKYFFDDIAQIGRDLGRELGEEEVRVLYQEELRRRVAHRTGVRTGAPGNADAQASLLRHRENAASGNAGATATAASGAAAPAAAAGNGGGAAPKGKKGKKKPRKGKKPKAA